MLWWSSLVVVLMAAQRPLAGVTEVLTEGDISYALAIASGSDATRAVFHAAYIVPVTDAIIERVEVITEFRRFVLAAEDQLKAGNWIMARGGYDAKGRTLKDLLRPFAGQVSFRARLRFHPQNSYTTLPPFDILLGEPTLLAMNAVRTPHIAVVNHDGGGSTEVITGATIETFYNAPTVNDRVLPVRVIFEGEEVARATVDFGRVQ